MLAVSPKPRLRSLLDHFSTIKNTRQPWKVMYPLREVILLVVCGTVADCDDYDDIADWGAAPLDFLRSLSEFHYGIPCEDWLRVIMNRIDPALFSACFEAWVAERWPEAPSLVALDGKTSRRSHDEAAGRRALHLVSAFATNRHLVLGQEAVEEKSNEIIAIPALLSRLALEGALVTIDAMGCNPGIAQGIRDAKADYLLAVKDNQPTLHKGDRKLFRNGASGRSRGLRGHRQGTRTAGNQDLPRLPTGRLARSGALLSRCLPLPRGRRHRGDRHQGRAQRQGCDRTTLLHHLAPALANRPRRGGAQPLGNREQPALDARRNLQRGSLPLAQRSRRQEHGRRPTLRHQSRQRRKG
jgi:DDE_Tnp_1-associated/Transposase DDE domain